MYILDTNVISELRKGSRAEPRVIQWAASVPNSAQYLSAMVIFELELGILQIGRRDVDQAKRIDDWLQRIVIPSFADRILPIDHQVALLFARMMVPKTRPYRDAMIAATAQHHGHIVVTRSIRDFSDLPVRTLNPWEA